MRSLGSLLVVAILLVGCVGPHYTTRQFIGVEAPEINSAEDVVCHLRTHPNPEVNTIAAITGFVTTPFKCIGIFGWTDYHMQAEAYGEVVYDRLSSDRLFTVDMKLEKLLVNGHQLDLSKEYFIRVEVYLGKVKVSRADRCLKHPRIMVRGRLVWDGDGHLEIHPENDQDFCVIAREPIRVP